MEDFYRSLFSEPVKGVRRISSDQLEELRKKGISVEQFLNYLCQRDDVLLHGSIHEIAGDKLKSRNRKIFVTDEPAIAILDSIYSNSNVNLSHSYFITEQDPLELEILVPKEGKYVYKKEGLTYVGKGLELPKDLAKSTYPNFISRQDSLFPRIQLSLDGKYISVDKGFIYVVDTTRLKLTNDPPGSWQFITDANEIKFHTVIEVAKDDFKYPVEVREVKDLRVKQSL